MKKSRKAICSLILLMLMAMSLATRAFADSPSITFQGFSKGFDFRPGSEYTETDLFGNFKNLMPGDAVTETITFTNAATDWRLCKPLYAGRGPQRDRQSPQPQGGGGGDPGHHDGIPFPAFYEGLEWHGADLMRPPPMSWTA